MTDTTVRFVAYLEAAKGIAVLVGGRRCMPPWLTLRSQARCIPASVGQVLTRRMLSTLHINARFASAMKPIWWVKIRPMVCAFG